MEKAIIFDMDGLMIETALTWQAAEKALLEQYGKIYDKNISKKYQGMDIAGVTTVMIEEYGLPISREQGIEFLTQKIIENYQNPALQLLPGCKELVNELRRYGSYRLGIASSSPKKIIQAMTERFELTSMFDQIVSAEEVVSGKPAPDIFLECAKRLTIEPKNCLVLEDAPNGIEAAQKAMMKVIAVYNPVFYTPSDLKQYAPTRIVSSLEQLNLHVIDTIFRSP